MSTARISQTVLNLIIGLMAVGLGVVAIGLFSQFNDAEEPLPRSLPESADEVSDDQLKTFARIFSEVLSIQSVLKADMRESADQRAVEQAEQRAEEKMIDAVHRNGMEVEEYNRIAMLLNENPELFDRYQKIEQEAARGIEKGQ
jgi:hypothetical protein